MKRATTAAIIGVSVVIVGILLGGAVLSWLSNQNGAYENTPSSPHVREASPTTARPEPLRSRPRGENVQDAVTSTSSSEPESGSISSITLSTGFIFVDGKYVDAPYVLTIEQSGLAVNGRVVERRITPVVRPDPQEITVTEMPVSPAWVGRDTTVDELLRSEETQPSFVYLAWRYLAAQTEPGNPVRMQQYIAYLTDLPCIKSAVPVGKETQGMFGVRIQDHHGNTSVVGLPSPAPSSPVVFDPEAELVRQLTRYEGFLRLGACLFAQQGRGIDKTIGREMVAQRLGVAAEILRSSRGEAEKITLLQELGIGRAGGTESEWNRMLVRGFEASSQLEDRVLSLVKETGVVPMTMADLEAAGSSD